MTYPGKGFATARVVEYRQRVMIDGKERNLRCIVGPIEEARSLMQLTMAARPGAWLLWEKVNHALGEARYEIVMPPDE